jgi:predicted ribosome quality control (RQC) complex YloA/Tae2 family protein
MKTEMSSLDCLAVALDLQTLVGARINKIYQVAPGELKLTFNVPGEGKKDLVIEAGKRVHTTAYPKPSPKTPTTFAMTLRKYLGNSVLQEVGQHAFDRILEFIFEGPKGEYVLTAELFGGGNVLLLDRDKTVLAVMRPQRYKDRELLGRRTYEYPPQRINPMELDAPALGEHLKESGKDLVRFLAMDLGLGGQLAEEVCHRGGVDKEKVDLGALEVEGLYSALMGLLNEAGKGDSRIVLEEGKPVDLQPVRLAVHEGMEQKTYPTFLEAADEYFTRFEIKKVDAIREDLFQQELGALMARMKHQTRVLKKHIKTERESKVRGDLIYSHFSGIEEILNTLHGARKDHTWEEIKAIIQEGKERSPAAKMVKSILPKEGVVVLELDSTEVRIDLRKNASQNAEGYYEKSKKARRKIPQAVAATRETVAKIRRLKERGKEAMKVADKRPEKRVVKKKAWYEKFRWFVSSDGFLVLGGRDASTNEVLVKRHMEPHDIFVHAEIHGAPAVVVKTEGREVPATTIQEAFDFAASYSKAWKHGIYGLDVYWVRPEQVSKTTEHGEYVTRGAFIIRGKRNFGKGVVEAAVGVKIEDGESPEVRVMGGPPAPIEKDSSYGVRITPGRMKSQEVAREIKSHWLQEAKEEEKELLETIPLEDIQVFLPPGGSEVKG